MQHLAHRRLLRQRLGRALRQQVRQRAIERLRLPRGQVQQRPVTGQQAWQHLLGERVEPHVPVDQNAVVDVGDLRIQRHLRPLRDDPAETAEGVGDPFGKQRLAADAETGGKHHR